MLSIASMLGAALQGASAFLEAAIAVGLLQAKYLDHITT